MLQSVLGSHLGFDVVTEAHQQERGSSFYCPGSGDSAAGRAVLALGVQRGVEDSGGKRLHYGMRPMQVEFARLHGKLKASGEFSLVERESIAHCPRNILEVHLQTRSATGAGVGKRRLPVA